MSMIGRVGGVLSKAMGRGVGPFAIPTAAFAGSLVEPIAEGVQQYAEGGDRIRDTAALLHAEQDQQEMRLRRYQRIRRSVAENTVRLAQFAPQLYASLMAGQELPEGGTMIGGQPNEDLVSQVAYMMSKGAFNQQE